MDERNSTLKAALWMGGWLALMMIMSVGGRTATAALNVFQVMEMRSLMGLAMLAPLVWRAGGFSAMRTTQPGRHVLRNAAHYAGQAGWFFAITMIPLAQVVAIEFTMPIWAALLALLMLGERLTAPKLAAIALGLIGVVMIVRPDAGHIATGHLIMLAAAAAFGVSLVLVKSLTNRDSALRIIFWMLVIQSIFGLVPAILVWRTPTLDIMPAVVLVAFCGTFSHYCMTRALAHAEATTIMTMDFLRVPLAALLGWAVYAEAIDIWTAAGAALILGGNVLNIQRPRRPVEEPIVSP